MTPYDRTFDPPAPGLSITIAGLLRPRRRLTLQALLDTGADVTAIPEQAIASLHLEPRGQLHMEGLRAEAFVVPTYAIQFTLANQNLPRLEVISTGLDFAIVGRDVLNRLYMMLNGPERMFDLSPTPFR